MAVKSFIHCLCMRSDFESSDDERGAPVRPVGAKGADAVDEPVGRPVSRGKKLQRTFMDAQESDSEDESDDEEAPVAPSSPAIEAEASASGPTSSADAEDVEPGADAADGLDENAIDALAQSILGDTTFGAEKVKKLSTAQLEKEQRKIRRSGVVYLSSIPPYMKPQKVRHIMSRFGEVGRLYLKPEDQSAHKSRVKQGGNKKKKFDEGWVEFQSKRAAKLAAQTLNGEILGGKKGTFYHDDVMNVKYLSGFKWFDLTNALNREIEVRDAKKQTELQQANKINKQYVKNLEQSRTIERIVAQKRERGQDTGSGFVRTFNQNKIVTMRADAPEEHKAKRAKTGAGTGTGTGAQAAKPALDAVLDKLF